MGTMASQITSITIVYSSIYSRTDQSPASLAFVRGIHRWPVNSPHNEPVTRNIFPFDDVIISNEVVGDQVKCFTWLTQSIRSQVKCLLNNWTRCQIQDLYMYGIGSLKLHFALQIYQMELIMRQHNSR